MSEEKTTLVWVLVCSFLGLTFGYFFNTGGIKIIATIWFMIFCAGLVLCKSNVVLGWLMFGVSLGITVALLHYESWLSPLLR